MRGAELTEKKGKESSSFCLFANFGACMCAISDISVHLNITIILSFQILSYRPGDLSIIIVKLHAASGALLSVVASSLEGS